jgi:methionyl-tRNA synthetase
MPKYYLTTAIDYVNAAPHIGHAYEKIAADIIARYYRLVGHDVFFLTGTDEHGTKVEKTAAAAGKSPKEFVDEIVAKFQLAWKRLNISNDYFIRTTEPRHEQVVQEIFRRMRDNGDIYKGEYVGLYCEGCEDYLKERDLVNGNCANHGKPPVQAREENYFFKLTKYKEPLRKWLSQEGSVKPDGRRREVLNQLDDEDFGDFSVSRPRTSLQWGIPVPDDPDHVIYVWIDALTNYITGVGYLTDEQSFKKWWPADLHLIGKDIVKFHCIFWPAMLMSCNIAVPSLVFGHGFITVEGQKMSKTLGNVLDPNELVDQWGADSIRYYLFAANTFDQDGDFARADMINTVNGHLANGYANLLNRTLKLIDTNCQSKVPAGKMNPDSLNVAQQAERDYHRFMEQFEFAKALDAVRSIVDEANKYINDQKPWELFKQAKAEEGASVLLTSLELLRRATLLYAPFVPELSAKVWQQLGYDSPVDKVKLSDPEAENLIPAGQPVRNTGPAFPRLEDPTAQPSAKK